MAPLIDRDKIVARLDGYLKDCIEEGDYATAQIFEDCICEILDMKVVSSKEEPKRPKGHWILVDPHTYRCSECKTHHSTNNLIIFNERVIASKFCPDCGAEMEN